MRRHWLSACAGMTMMVAGCAPSEPPAADARARPAESCGALAAARFDEPGLPARDYYVYAPCGLKKKDTPPLVVYLHGCTQNAPDVAVQTRWNQLADEHGLVVVYPEQYDPNTTPFGPQQLQDHLLNGNGGHCWNWFRPEQIMRGAGEAATIAGITQRVIDTHQVDPDRVFAMGISAGGAMTAVMGATYPELYRALAMAAGVSYPVGTDPSGTLAFQAMGERPHPMPALVVQGTLDEVVVLPLGVEVTQQWLGTNDWVDDGQPNGSVPRLAASTEHHGFDESALAGAGTVGDPCVGTVTSPCPGAVIGMTAYPYTIEHYLDASGAPLLDFWIIHGLAHNYSGGDPSIAFSDPLGPDITKAAYDFFMAQPSLRP